MATLLDTLDVRGATMVGHSTSGGEIARYIGRRGPARVSKAVLISAVPPHMLQTPTNPTPRRQNFSTICLLARWPNRSGFYEGIAKPFFVYNRRRAKVSHAQIHVYWLHGTMGIRKRNTTASRHCPSPTDFTDDLKMTSIPTLCL